MKLFNLSLLSLAAAGRTDLSRPKRDTEIAYSFNGEESAAELLEMILALAGEENDEIEKEIMKLMNVVERNLTEEQERKFRNLKVIVLWLQKGNQFGKYCYYGCYCLPEGSHDIANGGYGQPQDDIDRACFDFKQCYHCLIEEHEDKPLKFTPDGKCRGEEVGYAYTLDVDQETGEKSVTCTNKPGSCRRNVCECDKRLAEKFAQFEEDWDEKLHKNRGGFKRDEHCFKGTGGGNPIEECCGTTFTFPDNKPRRTNQCCAGTDALPAGTC